MGKFEFAGVAPRRPRRRRRPRRPRRRRRRRPRRPRLLSEELATNPFLRASDPAIRQHLNMSAADNQSVFAEIRARKDNF